MGRFFTEFYRGDSFRGENILWNLSTSQVFSLLLISFGLLSLIKKIYQKHSLSISYKIGLIFATLGISGCFYPQPPDAKTFISFQTLRPGLEEYQGKPLNTFSKVYKKRGNALFLTADTYIYSHYLPQIQKELNTKQPPSLDDLVWWEYAPIFSRMYNQIIRITYQEARYETLLASLNKLESMGESFDVYLLSHGMPNHLSSGTGWFLSYKELSQLEGHFKNLNLVFMQSCWGSSLTKDWINAGAKHVISFNGQNRNFFWISFFLRWYQEYDILNAYRRANDIEWELDHEIMYKSLLHGLNLNAQTYLAQSPNPELY